MFFSSDFSHVVRWPAIASSTCVYGEAMKMCGTRGTENATSNKFDSKNTMKQELPWMRFPDRATLIIHSQSYSTITQRTACAR